MLDLMLDLDIDSPLRPLDGDDPAGADLRYEGTYDRIREARREDDASLPQGVWTITLKRADWVQVRDLAVAALSGRSKDLQIAIWLTEALTRLDGPAGLSRGLDLVASLCRRFWPLLYPKIADDDLEYRLGPLFWLNEKLPLVLQEVAVTRTEGNGEQRNYTWEDWQKALRLDVLAQRDRQAFQRAEAVGEVTRPKFLASVGLTPTAFYRDMAAALAAAAEALDRLAATLDRLCGAEAPSFGRLSERMQQMDAFIRQVLDERGEIMAVRDNTPRNGPRPVAEPVPPLRDTAVAVIEIPSAGAIRSREEAYRRLAEVADYLMRTEPHSPTPYLLKRAVSWGNMTLGEVLHELVSGGHDLASVYQLLGIHDAVGGR